jgi:hypothetical protein
MNVLKRTSVLPLAIILVVLLLTGFSRLHQFYVSLSEIRFNTESQRLEVSLRFFPDDMDRALKEHIGVNASLVTVLEHKSADSLLEIYLHDLFRIELKGVSVPLSYLGKEAESDVMWCYLESFPQEKPVEITVYNSILCEIFEDQVNIIQVYVDTWNRGLLLNRDEPQGKLVIKK